MFAHTWRCDGSEGITWNLFGIQADGLFYGEIRYRSNDPARRKARLASGQLSPAECERTAELLAVIRQLPPPVEPGPHFAALFEWFPAATGRDVRRLFEYHRDDELHSPQARAFLELAGLIERHLAPFYADIT